MAASTETVEEETEKEKKENPQQEEKSGKELEKEEEKESVRRFVKGLSPFISALEEDGSATGLMRPIRELIYKSFTNPSEGEEGVIYVMNELELLNKYCNGDGDRNGGSVLNDDLVIRSIGHFLSLTLPPSWIDSMCRWMLDRMQLILLKFFTFKHYCSCYFNSDIANSRLFVLQCALHRRFPLLISEGCASLSRCPVFYGTKQCCLFSDNNFIRCSWQLLQTGASFKVVPLHRHRSRKKKDSLHNAHMPQSITPLTMDLRTLEQEIERDQSKGKLPCVVIASSTDNLQKIRSICDRHGLWLHIEGTHASSSSLLLAAATTLPKHTRIMMQCADSISCQPFKWFTNNEMNDRKYKYKRSVNHLKPQIIRNKITNKYKVVTNYKSNRFGDDIPGCSSTLTFIKEDLRDTPPPSITYSDSDFVMMFPLWHLLVTCSIKQIKNRVDHCLNLCHLLNEQLLERKNIFTTSLLFKASTASVIFQISPNMNIIDLSAFKLDINTFHELLINRCCKEMNNLHLSCYDEDTCTGNDEEDEEEKNKNSDDDEDHNITRDPYFRFEPLCMIQPETIKHEFISSFIETIVVEINILRKCLELRRVFQECISRDYDLEFVDAMTVQSIMIGLGAFRFVPSFFKNNTESESVHLLNKCLCDELNERNANRMTQMFKLSMDLNGIVCIVINPTTRVFEENCIETIYSEIYECHKKMKYPQQVMDVMAQAIKSGIDDAQKVVQDQASADYSVDSIVRKVPLFGSVYGWLLPEYHSNDANHLLDNTGNISFQIGVGMTKPQIQRQMPMHNDQDEQTENDNDNDNDNENNDNNNDNE